MGHMQGKNLEMVNVKTVCLFIAVVLKEVNMHNEIYLKERGHGCLSFDGLT